MSVQLPPVGRKDNFARHQAARLEQSRTIVAAAPWKGERSRRWSIADVLIHSDVIPVAFVLFLAFLIVGR